MAELVHESLGSLGLLHDSLFVVLANGSRQFVVVHGRSVLPFPPETSDADAVFDLEYALLSVQPADAGTIELRLLE